MHATLISHHNDALGNPYLTMLLNVKSAATC